MKLFNLLTFLTLWIYPLWAQSINVMPDHSFLQYSGRIEFTPFNVARFSMPSSSIKIKFTGTELKATFSAKNFDGDGKSYLYVIVDGKADPLNRNIIEVYTSKRDYTLAEGLTEGEHIVEVVKVNEYWGMVEFHGFDIGRGQILPLPSKPNRLIEYYGDSNPSGWSAWNDKDQGGDAESGGYYTYPAFTARALNADLINFTAGGHGITPNMGKLDLTRYYDKIHIKTDNQSTNNWDLDNNYLNKKPDVIVINLGANDYYNGASKQQQKTGWKKLVTDQLRPHYPNAHIVLGNSEGWAVGEPADYVDEMIEEFKAEGDYNISYVKFPWLWGQEHAVVSEQAAFSNILSEHIAKVMNWETPVKNNYSSFPFEGELLGNRSFENALLGIRPDGWRPTSVGSQAKVVMNKRNAKTGEAYIVCPDGSGVHQAVKAKQGDRYLISVWVKGNNGKAKLKYAFRNQGQRIIVSGEKIVETSSEWQQISLITSEASFNTWQIDIHLESDNATVFFDDIDMENTDVTSIEQHKKGLGWKVYPNPTNHLLFIKSHDNKVIDYMVYSKVGQKIYEGNSSQIDVSTWSKGVYFVKNKNNKSLIRFIKN